MAKTRASKFDLILPKDKLLAYAESDFTIAQVARLTGLTYQQVHRRARVHGVVLLEGATGPDSRQRRVRNACHIVQKSMEDTAYELSRTRRNLMPSLDEELTPEQDEQLLRALVQAMSDIVWECNRKSVDALRTVYPREAV